MLGIPLKARHFGRYKELLRLWYKHAKAERALREDAAPGELPEAGTLADDLERMGPTFVKLGQLLSTRSDLLPRVYTDALARLQDDVEPFHFAEVEAAVERELGVRLKRLFPEFEREPVAAASLAQTHRARLRDGTVVAVKVQRPGVRERFLEDIASLEEVAALLDERTRLGRRYEFSATVAELKDSLLRELDFELEARSLRRLSRNLKEFDRIVVPLPHEDYSTERVLTMDYVEGRNITSLTPLGLTEVDGPGLAGQLFRAYLKQILVDGFFHADPHPGNVLLTDDRRVALVDLGMSSQLPPGLQEDLLSLLLAVVDGRAETAAEVAIKIGHRRDGFNEAGFKQSVSRLVMRNKHATIAQIDTGRVILEITRFSRGNGLRLPSEMTMLGKALLNLDQAVWTLDPAFDPNQVIRDEARSLLQSRLARSVSQGAMFSGLIDVKKFAEKLPDRMGKILDVVGDNRLELKLKAFDEDKFIQGLQKIANRIAVGVLLGSLTIGAALLMRVETAFTLFGYPGLAILLFLGAAAGAAMLCVDILWYDR